jgi:LysR family transcriptional regulator (chromosome initiation inhibitor)
VLAGWGVSVLPELQVREHLRSGRLLNVAPGHVLPVDLYWHCWNLDSVVLDALTAALTDAAAVALR